MTACWVFFQHVGIRSLERCSVTGPLHLYFKRFNFKDALWSFKLYACCLNIFCSLLEHSKVLSTNEMSGFGLS